MISVGSLSRVVIREITDLPKNKCRTYRSVQDASVHSSGLINTREGQLIHKKNNRAIELDKNREKRLKKLAPLQADLIRYGIKDAEDLKKYNLGIKK